MGDLFIVRRANGECLAERINGMLRIPVWSSEDEIARYKARNPDLMVYLPSRLDRRMMNKILSSLGPDVKTEFFLLAESAPEADLEKGSPIAVEEVFSDS